MFEVSILNANPHSPSPVIYEGTAACVFLPGVEGEFEVLDFHKPIISKLKKGTIVVDNSKEIPIRGGIVKMKFQKLVAVVDV